jgi:hypothetical protein
VNREIESLDPVASLARIPRQAGDAGNAVDAGNARSEPDSSGEASSDNT